MSKTKSTAFDDVKALNLSGKELIARFGRQAIVAKSTTFDDPAIKTRAQELIEVIDRDAHEFAAQIQAVEKTHSNWPEVPKRGSHYTKALAVGGKYIGIIEDIHGVMGQASVELTSLMNNQNIDATQRQQSQQQPA